ncbi:MAG: alkaline phosphatase [Clostridia bacterium]|nr:alkaline phosphatase [Clostridia bacterium]
MRRFTSKALLVIVLAFALFVTGAMGVAAAGAKNVIVCIGDGMGYGAIQISKYALKGPSGRFAFELFPNSAIVTTYSLNALVTDSAAAATAIATGHKTNNGVIAMLPDGTVLRTILEAMKDAGKATGMVVTNTVYDATPAGFASHWNTRGGSAEIAAQLLDKELDVLMGGGRDQFRVKGVADGKRTDGRNLMGEATALGYSVVTDRQGLEKAAGDRILGLFHPSYMNYQLDRIHLGADEPTLSDMTAKALSVLKQKENGFFLMIEGSRIDHAAHAGDVSGVVAELSDFNEAVALAYQFAIADGNTLVIVTADHDTMGLSATEPFDYERMKQFKVSPEFMALQFKKADDGKSFDPASIRQVFAEYANVTDVTDADIALIQSMFGRAPYLAGYAVGAVLSSRLNAGIVSSAVQIKSPSSGGHTGNPVPLFAFGPGAELFGGVMDNTEISPKIAQAAGIEF